MPEIPEDLVPARYKGHGIGLREGMPYYNTDGTRRESLNLESGDEILLKDEDVYGKTLLHDPQGNKTSLYLGLGCVVLPEHKDLSDQERADLGYELHLGRPDFEPVKPLEEILRQREAKKTSKKKKPKEIDQTITIEQATDVPAEQGESEQS